MQNNRGVQILIGSNITYHVPRFIKQRKIEMMTVQPKQIADAMATTRLERRAEVLPYKIQKVPGFRKHFAKKLVFRRNLSQTRENL